MFQEYSPINCEFHDVLEATSVKRQAAVIEYMDTLGVRRATQARIVDLYAEAGAEYMYLDNGSTIRLDHVLSVDDSHRSTFDLTCAPLE